MKQPLYSVYLVRCADNSLYCGISTDVERRVGEHNGVTKTGKPSSQKKGAVYTGWHRPVMLVYQSVVGSRSDAMKEEYRIKKLSKVKKEEMLIH